jgi:SPP1 gp7 family putative phage head morphogenesis protein
MSKSINYSKEQLQNLIRDIYSGSINPSRLPVDLYNTIYETLLDGVFKGFGNTIDELADGSPEKLLAEYFQHNIAIFSGAKTFQQVNDMSNAVFTPEGYKREFSEFKKLITGDKFHNGLFSLYNVNYLRTEYNTAVRVAQNGRQFTEYMKDADIFPYLKYIAVHDERVREEHLHWDGITLPVGHKFWDTHVPPNGFNCRCRMVQLSEYDEFTITPENELKNAPKPDEPLFEFNPAKTGFIFDESKHPYTVKIGERFKPAQSVNFGFPTPKKPTQKIVVPELPTNPQPKFKPENLDEIFNVETDPKFWALLKKPTTVKANYKGKSFARGNSVDVDVVRFTTEYGMKKIIYHEFGHVIHDQLNWNAIGFFENIVDPLIEETFSKWKKYFKFSKKQADKFSYLSKFRSNEFKNRMRDKFPEIDIKDFNEQFSAMNDTIASLTKGRLGWGHDLSYWKEGRGYFDRAEFIAHAFENRFLGNELFKYEFPDLYNDMIKMIDDLILKENLKNGSN